MQTLTHEQALFLLHYSLPIVEREHQTTRAVIAAIPSTHADYRPDPNSKTAMELAWHIAAAENRFFTGIPVGAFDFTPNHQPDDVKTGPDIARWYDESFSRNSAIISKMSAEQACKVIDFRGIFQRPSASYLLSAISHTVHHRGQLSTYLRAMGGKVPAIYGESYDSALAKSAG